MSKPLLKVGIIGHRYLKNDHNKIKNEIISIFDLLKENYRIELYSSLAIGSDTIAAKVAIENNINLISVLPFPIKKYLHDFNDIQRNDFMYLINHSSKIIELDSIDYEEAADYLINNCDYLILVYNGKKLPLYDEHNKPINRGGTYDSLLKITRLNKKNIIINDN